MGTVKYTGSVASFHCPTNAEIRSLKVHFSPKQEGTGDPSPENVREIVGWDGVEVYRNGSTTNYEFGVLGKNKLDVNGYTQLQFASLNNNYLANTNTDTRDNFQLSVVGYNSSTMLGQLLGQINMPTGAYSNTFVLSSTYENMNLIYIKHNGITRDIGIKIPVDLIVGQTYTISMDVTGNDPTTVGGLSFGNLQLELGSAATAYEPYNPKHTVYGGWVDLISGEVCETHVVYTGGWVQYAESNGYKRYELTNILLGDQNNLQNISNIIKLFSNISSSTKDNCIQPVSQGSASIRAYLSLDENINVDSIQYGYKLATPNTYHLAPTQLQTFLGQNNVWSNADYVEVEYDLHETQDILARKQFIIANQPHLEELSGSIATFNTDISAPLKECKVEFKPIQDLHGYSNPWPAGGGKNLAKPYDNNYISSSYISFDYSAINGTFRCYGTASASSTHSSPSAINAVNNGATFTLPTGTYTLSIIDGDGANIYAQCVSSTETVLAETTSYTTFTTNESLTVFVRLKVAATATVDKTVKIQLEKGSSATSYAPYENVCPISGWMGINVTISPTQQATEGQTLPIDWTTEAGTVYGGYVDLVKGEIVQTHNYVINSLYANNYAEGSDGFWYTTANELSVPHIANTNAGFACNRLRPDNNTSGNSPEGVMTWYSNQIIRWREHREMTQIEYKAYLAENPLIIVYELATPIHYLLTSTQLKTLRGTNNIWASNGGDNIELSYWTH